MYTQSFWPTAPAACPAVAAAAEFPSFVLACLLLEAVTVVGTSTHLLLDSAFARGKLPLQPIVAKFALVLAPTLAWAHRRGLRYTTHLIPLVCVLHIRGAVFTVLFPVRLWNL